MTVNGKDLGMKKTMTLLCVCLIFAFQGCGKKGPPIPPGAVVPPRVTGLSYAIKDDTLTLSWKAHEGRGAGSVDGYEVMRSATSLDEKECEGCPIVFQRLAHLGSSETGFTDKLVLGKRYIYKVVAITSYNVPGKDSKLIRFNYPEVKKEEKVEQSEPEGSDESEELTEPDDGGTDGENPEGDETPSENESPEKAE